MEQFAGYGFNKSHSAAYAYLAYVTAYLKAHYPVEFMAALLTSETGNTAKVVKYINECREMGITVLPPDVNASALELHAGRRGDPLRSGRDQERGRRRRWRRSARRARKAGRSDSLYDFCEQVDLGAVNRRMIESLIKAGAMDSLGGDAVAAIRRRGSRHGSRTARLAGPLSGQAACSATSRRRAPPEKPLPKVPDWTAEEKLAGEKEMLGFYVTGHPLDRIAKGEGAGDARQRKLEGLDEGDEVALCGVLTGHPAKAQQGGQAVGVDADRGLAGAVEGMVFATTYERLGSDGSRRTKRCWCADWCCRRKTRRRRFR